MMLLNFFTSLFAMLLLAQRSQCAMVAQNLFEHEDLEQIMLMPYSYR